jgi:two-component system, NarL family, response regulator DesR
VIRVLIAEDAHLVRGALVALISLEPDIEVVADVERGDDVLAAVASSHPDVAILDIDLPGVDGLTAAEQLHSQVPTCRTLVVTGLSQPGHLMRALQAHVRGFMLKDAPADKLADAIRRVAAGERVLDPDLVAAALETGTSPLTAREADVLQLSETGISTEQIAATLYLSPATVRNYLSNAIAKLNARSRIDAIRIARQAGWL